MKPLGAISLDLDNLWSYLKIRGDVRWKGYPSYIPELLPVILDEFDWVGLRATIFVVGRDAARSDDAVALRSVVNRGHDIGNHSFEHEPWIDGQSAEQIRDEIVRAEQAIATATGVTPHGFRGPGYAFSDTLLDVLAERGYRYDASTLPTSIAPLARWYYFRQSGLDRAARVQRAQLFGRWSDALRPNRPYWLSDGRRHLLEIPVTVMPGTRFPFHVSYALYLNGISRAAALAYVGLCFELCRLTRTMPSLLLHPLDFVGTGEVEGLDFFPGMGLPGPRKREFVRSVLSLYTRTFNVVAMDDASADLLNASPRLCERSLRTTLPVRES